MQGSLGPGSIRSNIGFKSEKSDIGSNPVSADSPRSNVASAPELRAPAWLEQIGMKVENPRVDLSDKNAVYQDRVSNHYHAIKKNFYQDLVSGDLSLNDKKKLIDDVLKRLEHLGVQDSAQDDANKQFNQSLLPDVLRHVDNDALLQHAYQRVDGKLDQLARQLRGCLTMYSSASHHAVADTGIDPRKIEKEDVRNDAYRGAFYRALESGLSDIGETRVNSILSAGDDQQKLTKLTRHLLDRSFISPTLQHQEDIRKVFLSFRLESAKAEAFKVFADVVSADLDKMDKRAASLPARKAYVSHLAGVLTTFRSLKPGTPGGNAIDRLDKVIDHPENMNENLTRRKFPLEHRNLGTDALAGHLPDMSYKLRREVLNHIKARVQSQESLDKSREFKNDQVSKMIMAAVLGYPDRSGQYPSVERSNYARISDKKLRQDLVKLVYQNRRALTEENRADLMKVFKQFKNEVSSERDQNRWSSLRLFTRGGRTVNRMNEIDDQSVPMPR